MGMSKVSFIVCTLNCKDMLTACLASIRRQDYPRDLVKIYCPDSDSTDGTIEVIKKFGAILIPSVPKGYMEGKGMAKSIGVDRAIKDGADYIVTLDSDNELVEEDWIYKTIYPMEKDKEISFVISRMAVMPYDKVINRYCSYVGTDSFAVYKSLDPLISFGEIPLIDKGKYKTHRLTKENFKIFGGYACCYRRETLKKIGGYHRDVDNGMLMVEKGIALFGIPNNCHVHHKQAKSFWNHLRKKVKWGVWYFKEGQKDRKFNWDEDKSEFYWNIIKCLLFVPACWTSLRMLVKYKDSCWLIHPFMSFGTTVAYIVAFGQVKLSLFYNTPPAILEKTIIRMSNVGSNDNS